MSPFDVLLIIAGVGYVLGRRMIGQMVEIKGLVIVPVVLTVIGITKLRDLGTVDATTVVFVAIGCALSIGLGLIRGLTVHLGARDGHLWMRYRVSSVALWVANLAIKVALIPVERGVSGSSAAAADHAIMLSIGLGILAETAVVLLRAMRTDAVVVWEKGENGKAHRTSPAFEQARAWVADADQRPRSADMSRIRLPKRDW